MGLESQSNESHSHVRGVRVGAWARGGALLFVLAWLLCVPLLSQKRPPALKRPPSQRTPTPTPTPRPTYTPRPRQTPTPKPFTPDLRQYDFEVLTVDAQGVIHKGDGQKSQASYYVAELGNGVAIEMVKVERGTFMMGAADADSEHVREEYKRHCRDGDCSAALASEAPRHQVNVPAFYISRSEVTQAQWEAVSKLPAVGIKKLEARPSMKKSDPTSDLYRPVESVTWREAVEFCERLSRHTGLQYRLPTEAEWEYAARGGSEAQFAFGETVVPSIVNYNAEYPYGNAPKATKARGTTKPYKFTPEEVNGFGLYDLVGNVSEWCLDAWHDDYRGGPSDGSAWGGNSAAGRVVRGCSWADAGYVCRSTYRRNRQESFKAPTVGFRVVTTGKYLPVRARPVVRRRGR